MVLELGLDNVPLDEVRESITVELVDVARMLELEVEAGAVLGVFPVAEQTVAAVDVPE